MNGNRIDELQDGLGELFRLLSDPGFQDQVCGNDQPCKDRMDDLAEQLGRALSSAILKTLKQDDAGVADLVNQVHAVQGQIEIINQSLGAPARVLAGTNDVASSLERLLGLGGSPTPAPQPGGV